jgi:hypothetical protein
MSEITNERLKKIRICSHLLPDPGGEVVRELLDEIERLKELTKNLTGNKPPLTAGE